LKVYIRVRPLQKHEVAKEEIVFISNENKTIRVSDLTHYMESNYDHIFDAKTKQKEVFSQAVQSCVDSVLQGYNSTVFAYGQTGSGKTYTIFGDGFQSTTI